ncbi:MAG: UDP-N-acetylmuramoyl-L-alanyl-D-glutamate--2,6-diaminopimelate ligase [Bacteroidia bacterium]
MPLLKDILPGNLIVRSEGDLQQEVLHLTFDSREVKSGSLFFAVKGVLADGHRFISKATESGAVAVVCEEWPEEAGNSSTIIQVTDSREALAMAAAEFYEHPSRQLELVGVTGTNGKTTVCTLLYQLFTWLGYPSGLLSTVNVHIREQVVPATHTTPDPVELNKLLRQMVDEGCDYCFMEVSSHAVVQHRVSGLIFSGGVFTNITHDHLDYHLTFSDYIKAKKTFFDRLGKQAFALFNEDDKNGKVMVQNTSARIRSYGLRSMADYSAKVLENDITGMHLRIGQQDLYTQITGRFNASNLLAVFAVASELEVPETEILHGLSKLAQVEGRFDFVRSESGITGIVDYAHTPDALENVLRSIREINIEKGNVLTVVGCGGNRDKAKRPVMARLAAEYSDKVILTSDNPRNEDPEAIIDDMKTGLLPEDRAKILVITNRREAIRTACHIASRGDIVLVAGKGHEKYQEINGVKKDFDDKMELYENLKELMS